MLGPILFCVGSYSDDVAVFAETLSDYSAKLLISDEFALLFP